MAEEKTVKLAVNSWQHYAFDPSIEGVEVITREGTVVPTDKEQEVREKARKAGISLRKVG